MNQDEITASEIRDPLDTRLYTGRSLQELREAAKKHLEIKRSEAIKNIQEGIDPIIIKTPDPWKIDYSHARLHFWNWLKKDLEKQGQKPYLYPGNAGIMKNLIKWLIMDDSGIYNIHKGLFITGNYGMGKTFIVKKLISWAKGARAQGVTNLQPYFEKYDYKEIMLFVRQKKSIDVGIFFRNKDLFIDDLGYFEDTQIVLFGDKINLTSDIIYHRHRASERGIKTILTSNLTPDMIEEHGGQGSKSRLHEMCNIIIWKGEKDLRTIN